MSRLRSSARNLRSTSTHSIRWSLNSGPGRSIPRRVTRDLERSSASCRPEQSRRRSRWSFALFDGAKRLAADFAELAALDDEVEGAADGGVVGLEVGGDYFEEGAVAELDAAAEGVAEEFAGEL